MSKRGRSMRDKLAPIGRVIHATGAARFYHDGDGAGFVWRAWHPLAWLCAPILFGAHCVVAGVPDTVRNRHDVGFGMKPWFRLHPERLEWE
jgi:hypothetical protein